ncbi:MAG: hypothetical protein IPG60_12740 [Bacteroidetes bacterium]|nr:hypothetical protein [Bacteroidota bacterium]MBP7398228.1 hypothetical protein [Chitinophagales bacterium]MBK7109811.1 hypothetical protein [Bacteroidota bacterium]MBK8487452.1 hypothetical protein [Bacteroidota bacterium]MBK8682805.1 hypothetical protein [Bacteroidota bacterium]
MIKIFFSVAITAILITSCIKPPEYPIEPFIRFESVNKVNFIKFDPDSLKVDIYFEDGDGDIGGLEIDSLNMFWEDSRVPGYRIGSKIPFVNLEGNHKAISGVIHATRGISTCISATDVDTFHYSIQIRDRAGNWSNIIETPDLYINCD